MCDGIGLHQQRYVLGLCGPVIFPSLTMSIHVLLEAEYHHMTTFITGNVFFYGQDTLLQHHHIKDRY